VDFEGRRFALLKPRPGATLAKAAPDAWDLLRNCLEIREEGNPYVFPGLRPGTHLKISNALLRVRAAAACLTFTFTTCGAHWLAASQRS